MKDFEGYFTLDGSVGLYSASDNDIYHSVYGALSEAYDKFICPANLNEYFEKNNKIEILDICYGIGYNTKSFLNYFLENIYQKKNKKNKTLTANIDPIYTDNISQSKVFDFSENKNSKCDNCNVAIHSNNNLVQNSKGNLENLNNKKNIFKEKAENNKKFTKQKRYSIFIKAIDVNSTLVKLSPFIKMSKKANKYLKTSTGIAKVDELLSKKINLKNIKSYKLLKEVNMILIIKLIDKFKEDIFSKDVVKILTDNETSKFFDKNMVNFAKFYLKKRYNLSTKENKLTFLHNIYYQYISKSYKNTLNVLKNNEINIDFKCDDARKACKDISERYDYIFLDAFSPVKAPILWSEDFMKLLYCQINYNGLLLTYSKSALVRNAMLKSNFEVGKIYNNQEKKIIGTLASKNYNKIKYKLNAYELGLINTLAGVTFKDENLNLSNSELIDNRNKELECSILQSSSNFIKNFRGNKNEI